jgi:hypothetical protein
LLRRASSADELWDRIDHDAVRPGRRSQDRHATDILAAYIADASR